MGEILWLAEKLLASQEGFSLSEVLCVYVCIYLFIHSFILQNVQTCSGAHPASCSTVTWGSFPRVKRPAREVDHSETSSAEVKSKWSYTTLPLYTCVA
jgi:hypothetical protein